MGMPRKSVAEYGLRGILSVFTKRILPFLPPKLGVDTSGVGRLISSTTAGILCEKTKTLTQLTMTKDKKGRLLWINFV